MRTTYRAADVPATSRKDYWNHVTVTVLGQIDLRVIGDVDVRDQLVVGEIGVVRVGMLSPHQPGGARLTGKSVRDQDGDFCQIDILARGEGVVAQNGREAHLRPGDLTFV